MGLVGGKNKVAYGISKKYIMMEYLLERLMMLYKKLQAALAELEGMEERNAGSWYAGKAYALGYMNAVMKLV